MSYGKIIIEDLLKSVKRLNEECNERVKFEEKLMKVIDSKDAEIDELNTKLLNAMNNIADLSSEYDKKEEEIRLAMKLKKFVENTFLKEDEILVWNAFNEIEIVKKDE